MVDFKLLVVEFLSAAPHPNLKEQKELVRENGPKISYNGRTELIRGIHHDRIMKARSNGSPFSLHIWETRVGIKISGNGGADFPRTYLVISHAWCPKYAHLGMLFVAEQEIRRHPRMFSVRKEGGGKVTCSE
jgi:hypothetical protein